MLLVWSAAGVVALVAGMMWGARAGVQFALVDLALKSFTSFNYRWFLIYSGSNYRRLNYWCS